MSCSMEIVRRIFFILKNKNQYFIKLFASATRQFQMSILFKRLFDSYGKEIFVSEDIIYGMEYYVSTGENFINPLRAIECKLNIH